MNLSPAWLLASLFVGSAGTGFFVYGKKQLRMPQLLAGIVLVAESMFVPSPGWMLSSAALVLTVLWGALRAGI